MKWTLCTALLLPALALAGNPEAAPGGNRKEWGEHHEWAEHPEKSPDELIKMARTAEVVALASKLDLDTAQALQIDAQMKKFDEQRKPLRQQLIENGKTVMKAAHGDEAAQKELDNAIKKTLDARDRLASLDKDLYWTVSKGLPPQKRAQMALLLAHFQMRNRARWMKHVGRMHHRDGEHAQLDGQGTQLAQGSSDDDDSWDSTEE